MFHSNVVRSSACRMVLILQIAGSIGRLVGSEEVHTEVVGLLVSLCREVGSVLDGLVETSESVDWRS